jgi:mRNA interferase MazF
VGTSSVMKRGTVVLVRFPFSDLSASKLRPAVVLADVGRGDYALVQVTSNPYGDSMAVELTDDSFESGGLHRISYARPGKLFTANESLIERSVGELTTASVEKLISAIARILRPPDGAS